MPTQGAHLHGTVTSRTSALRQLLLLLALVASLPFHAPAQTSSPGQASKPTVLPSAPPHEQPLNDRTVPKLTAPLRLADFEGMAPAPALADHLAHVSSFTQTSPNDGQPATEKTDVYLGYTPTTLYVVFVCFDGNPGRIRSHLARRENVTTDDNVAVLLDPFQDHRRGILFELNPAGVQADAAWTDQVNTDYSYDQVWDSDGRITSGGWMALFAIPFRSVRFHGGSSDWGVVLTRHIPRNSEIDNWPHIATSVSGTLTQEGTLRGIEGVTGSHNLQLNPYALAQNVHQLLSLDPNNPFFSTRHLEGTAGGDAKAILHDTIVVDATVNPDFSQVESDQPQFTVNQRYPVYFPELRPFFLENANYFSTPINLLYTRNIVHPEFGVRATGKLGNTNIGLLAIDDRAPGESFHQGAPDFGKHALFAVGRVTQDLGKGSSIGAIYTDYEFAGGFNRIGGLDFTARFNDKWTALGQIVESASRYPGDPSAGSSDPSGAPSSAAASSPPKVGAGPASWLEVSRNGHSFNLDNVYQDNAAGFASQVGFIQTTNIRNDQWHATYLWYPKHSLVQSFGLETSGNVSWDHGGNRVQHHTTVDPFVQLPRKTTIAPLMGQNSDTLGPQDGYALPGNINLTQNFGGLVVRSAPFRQLNWNVVYTQGGNPNFYPAPGHAPSLLYENYLQALVSVLPVHSLTIDNTYLLDRNHQTHTNEDVFESQTLRTKLNYQFTRAFSARVIVEYDSVLVNPAQTSLVRTKQVATQALFTWLPHPGTAIYFGYNNDLQNLDRDFCDRGPDRMCIPTHPILPRSNQYLNDGRQFFLKASYLLRF